MANQNLIVNYLGFGFNIVGGTDGPYIPGHDGIFICHVRNAELEGQINAGDRIISVSFFLNLNQFNTIFGNRKESGHKRKNYFKNIFGGNRGRRTRI
jgi:hypothetical protein